MPQGMASIGVSVKIGTATIANVQDFSDIGGAPSELDATCLKDSVKKTVPGVQDAKAWEITYLFGNGDATSDFRVIKGLQAAGNAVAVEVAMPDGTKFASTGYVSTYLTGAKVDELLVAKAVMNLQSDWTVTNPAAQ